VEAGDGQVIDRSISSRSRSERVLSATLIACLQVGYGRAQKLHLRSHRFMVDD
jgi:hypothetical protein